MVILNRTRLPLISLLCLCFAGCAQEASKAVSVDICSVKDHPGQLVTTEALISSDGERTLLRGEHCPRFGLELRLTDAAFRGGQIEKLRAAVRAAPTGSSIAVQFTGVLAPEGSDQVFAAQSVGQARYLAVN